MTRPDPGPRSFASRSPADPPRPPLPRAVVLLALAVVAIAIAAFLRR